MANISRDSFDSTKNFQKLLFQRGRPVLDSELNELQDIVRFQQQSHSSEMSGSGVAKWTSLFVDASGGLANDVVIKAGRMYVEGEVYVLGTDTLLSTLMGTASPIATAGGSNTFAWIYVDFQEGEISAAVDSTIANPKLGETTRRRKLQATFGVSNGLTPPAAPAGNGPIIGGGVRRVVIARAKRTVGVAAVASADMIQLAPPSRSADPIYRSSLLGFEMSGVVVWDSGNLVLTDPGSASPAFAFQTPWCNGTLGGTYAMPYSALTPSILAVRVPYFAMMSRSQYIEMGSTALFAGSNAGYLDDHVQVFTAETFDTSGDWVPLAVRVGNNLYFRDGDVLDVSTGYSVKTTWNTRANQKVKFTVGGTTADIKTGTQLVWLLRNWPTYFPTKHLHLLLKGDIIINPQVAAGATELVSIYGSGSACKLTIEGESTSSLSNNWPYSIKVNPSDYADLTATAPAIRITACDFELKNVRFMWTSPPAWRSHAILQWTSGSQGVSKMEGAQIAGAFVIDATFESFTAKKCAFVRDDISGNDALVYVRCTNADNGINVNVGTYTFEECYFDEVLADGSHTNPYRVCDFVGGNAVMRRCTLYPRQNLVLARGEASYPLQSVVLEDNVVLGWATNVGGTAHTAHAGFEVKDAKKLIRINRNVVEPDDPASTAGLSHWTAGGFVEITYPEVYSMAGLTIERIEVKDNVFKYSQGIPVGIRVRGPSTSQTTRTRRVEVCGNDIIRTSETDTGFGWSSTGGAMIDVGGAGGGITTFMASGYVAVDRNSIYLTRATNSTYYLTGISVWAQNDSGDKAYDQYRSVSKNKVTILKHGESSGVNVGILVEASNTIVEGNRVRAQSGLASGDHSTGILVYAATGVSLEGNTIYAYYPVDFQGASSYCYFFGNITRECQNPGTARTALANGNEFSNSYNKTS